MIIKALNDLGLQYPGELLVSFTLGLKSCIVFDCNLNNQVYKERFYKALQWYSLPGNAQDSDSV